MLDQGAPPNVKQARMRTVMWIQFNCRLFDTENVFAISENPLYPIVCYLRKMSNRRFKNSRDISSLIRDYTLFSY